MIVCNSAQCSLLHHLAAVRNCCRASSRESMSAMSCTASDRSTAVRGTAFSRLPVRAPPCAPPCASVSLSERRSCLCSEGERSLLRRAGDGDVLRLLLEVLAARSGVRSECRCSLARRSVSARPGDAALLEYFPPAITKLDKRQNVGVME